MIFLLSFRLQYKPYLTRQNSMIGMDLQNQKIVKLFKTINFQLHFSRFVQRPERKMFNYHKLGRTSRLGI